MQRKSPPSPAVAQLLCILFSLSPALLAVLTAALRITGELPRGEPIAATLYGPLVMILAGAAVFVSRVVKKTLMRRPLASLADRLRVTLVAMSIADVGAIGGLLYFIFSGDLIVTFMIQGIALIGTASHVPKRAWLAEARQVPGVSPPPPGP